MAAYIIVNVDVHDPARYQDYVNAVPPTVEAYGGRFIVRGGKAESLEGDYRPRRVVVIQFESAQRARDWWNSVEYAAPKALRQATSYTDMMLVEGV